MRIKLRNLIPVIFDQGPPKRFFRNLFKGNLWGVIISRSHLRDTGQPKIMYNTRETALKAASSMEKKVGTSFGTYKCLYCEGYHIGKNVKQK